MTWYITQMFRVNSQKINKCLLHLEKILGRLLCTWAGYISKLPARWGGSKFSRVLHPGTMYTFYLDMTLFPPLIMAITSAFKSFNTLADDVSEVLHPPGLVVN